MNNRIKHVLKDWYPEGLPQGIPGPDPVMQTGRHAEIEEPAHEADPVEVRPPRGPYPMPRGINMLMPVELCINRSLMISLLSASIAEMLRHKKAGAGGLSPREEAELDAALQQQLAFRSWIKDHPMSYISMALYPVTDADPADELDGLDDLDLPGA